MMFTVPISRQGIGLLDAFTGVFLGVYYDVFLTVGFAAIVFRSPKAIDVLVEETDTPFDWFVETEPDTSEPDVSA